MPISPLDLTKRSETGSALTQAQFDQNLTDIETAVNALIEKAAIALNDDGTLKDNVVTSADKITNAIITLAKLAVLSGGDLGGFLRANPTTGVIEAHHLNVQKANDTTVVNSTGVQTGLALASHVFSDVPEGDVGIWVKMMAKRQAGSNGGTISVKVGATVVDQVATHNLDGASDNWIAFTLFGKLEDFAGGELTVDIEFETSESDSDVLFGVDGEQRFGRACLIAAGIS